MASLTDILLRLHDLKAIQSPVLPGMLDQYEDRVLKVWDDGTVRTSCISMPSRDLPTHEEYSPKDAIRIVPDAEDPVTGIALILLMREACGRTLCPHVEPGHGWGILEAWPEWFVKPSHATEVEAIIAALTERLHELENA